MATVKFTNIFKHFGTFTAVKDLNLEVNDQEFLVLVGPSGCGKTTTLRMLAGLEQISEGTIAIGDKVVNDEPSKSRDIAMVFQSYALYPHYSIFDNLAFGLKTRNVKFSQNLFISGFQLLFYFSLTLFYGLVSMFIDTIYPDTGMLIFLAGFIGGIITLIAFQEVRRDITKLIVNFLSIFYSDMKEYKRVQNEIREKVFETAELLGIEKQLYKKPKQLSGGQRQRVALGRAIIREPQVFLMDEPLSNLDAKLRVQMRAELQRLQKKLKTTTIYVTHDQIEAMTLADRIVIMHLGVLQQVGTPDEVYNWPDNKFVAGFIGSPAMNFIEGKITSDGKFQSSAFSFTIPGQYRQRLTSNYLNKQVWLGVRPEHIKLKEVSSDNMKASVGVLEPIGSDTYVFLDFPDESEFIVKVEGYASVKLDEELDINFQNDKIHFFDFESEKRIIPE